LFPFGNLSHKSILYYYDILHYRDIRILNPNQE
jgi:hypothetical protein